MWFKQIFAVIALLFAITYAAPQAPAAEKYEPVKNFLVKKILKQEKNKEKCKQIQLLSCEKNACMCIHKKYLYKVSDQNNIK